MKNTEKSNTLYEENEKLKKENEELKKEIEELNEEVSERIVVEDIAFLFGKGGDDFDWESEIWELQQKVKILEKHRK
eukprot:COSAG01_NODE_5023_length_4539_cov_24.226577_6_plen_77_part_00